MSQRRKFPVYCARPKNGPGYCGHQHSDEHRARNCAATKEYKTRVPWVVFRAERDGREVEV